MLSNTTFELRWLEDVCCGNRRSPLPLPPHKYVSLYPAEIVQKCCLLLLLSGNMIRIGR